MKKKYYWFIIFLILALGFNIFLFYKNSSNKIPICESFIKNNNLNLFNTNDKKFSELLTFYFKIKKDFNNKDVLKEYEYDYKIDKAFYEKKCNTIKNLDSDNYTYDLCLIYVNKDYKKLDSFKFSDWDNKNDFIQTFRSLDEWKILSWAIQSIFISIHNFEKNKKNITFDFKKQNSNRWDYFTYFKENWKEDFLEKLDKQFLIKCKILNNEN